MMTHNDYMELALDLAARAKGFTSPNPCVGAVVVENNEIIGQGWHRAAGGSHAEVEAIDDARSKFPARLKGAAIYVTLEPCNHFGKTPPCTHKILNAGISHVKVGCLDPNPYVSGGGVAFLRQNGIHVETGILEDQSQILIEDFIWYTQNNKEPFVILKCAATLDGYIATATGDSQWITNEKSRAFGHGIRHQVDAILIGSGTLKADDPSLTARIPGEKTKDPARVILDTRLEISEEARVITQKSTAPTILVTGPAVAGDKKKCLMDKGVQVVEVDLLDGRLDLNKLMIKLGAMSILSLLIEGGGQVAASAVKAGIVNKVYYFLAPKFLGSNDGVPVFKGKGPEKIKDAFELDRVTIQCFDQDTLVTGYLDS